MEDEVAGQHSLLLLIKKFFWQASNTADSTKQLITPKSQRKNKVSIR
jgi:hypothetical protein